MSVLAGRRVLLTRPAGRGGPLASLIGDRGGEAVQLPLFEIQWHGDAHALVRQLEAARGWDGWIFTSASAAQRAAQLVAGRWPPLFCIGRATLKALAEAGYTGAHVSPRGSDSEALLQLGTLATPAGQRFLICTGVGGRDHLQATLRARGAQAERLELYRRVPLDYTDTQLRDRLHKIDAIVCTSGEGLERLHALTPDDQRAALLARVLVVPSPRVIELARRLGFACVSAPAQMSDAALVRCLEDALVRAPEPIQGSAPRPP